MKFREQWLCLIFVFNIFTTNMAMAQETKVNLTAAQVIDRIKEESGIPWKSETVDKIKTGRADTRVTGIAVCFTATMDVLREAVDKGCNLVITHEPTFYNHLDETGDLAGNSVYEEKQKFIDDHGLVIFRFHDHIHRMNPDGIEAGMIEKLQLPVPEEGFSSPVFHIRETTLKAYTEFLAKTFHSGNIRYIGDPDLRFTTLSLVAGAPASSSQIKMLEDPSVEVVLTGEAREWETVEYARDAIQQGRHKALILMGHANSEEAGMSWCASWLKGFISEVPVYFLEAGEPFGNLSGTM